MGVVAHYCWLASWICPWGQAASAESFEVLVIARVPQGLELLRLLRSYERSSNDSYGRLEAAGAFATISGIMVIVPIFSFAFGGLISDLIGWKGMMFGIFAGRFPALNWVFLPDTNPRPIPQIRLGSLAKDHLILVANPMSLTFMLSSSFCVGIFYDDWICSIWISENCCRQHSNWFLVCVDSMDTLWGIDYKKLCSPHWNRDDIAD